MLEVYLLRHGETQYNVDGNRYCGRTDAGLTGKGSDQANKVAGYLNGIKFDAIYSSPLERARRTAEIASGLTILTDQRLTEVDFGMWEGKTKEEFISENALLWDNWMQDPAIHRAGGTGETATEVILRVDDFFKEVQKKYPDGKILVVGHNGVNRLYMAYKLGMPLKNYRKIIQENASLTLITLDADCSLSLEKLNAV